jgi:hypothetical protein
VLALGIACAPDAPARPEPTRSTDKHALYGDAVLVPTREGERVRREVALAGQIEAALKVALDTPRVAADVELGEGRPRVAVAVRLAAPDPAPDATRAAVDALARSIVADAAVHVLLRAPDPTAPPQPSPSRPSAWLSLALLGLGVSLGIAAERMRLRTARRLQR